jgi:hypothetical protein
VVEQLDGEALIETARHMAKAASEHGHAPGVAFILVVVSSDGMMAIVSDKTVPEGAVLRRAMELVDQDGKAALSTEQHSERKPS